MRNLTINFYNKEKEITHSEDVVIYNIDDFPYYSFRYQVVSKRDKQYINLPCAFDIETTTIEDNETSTVENVTYIGFMYIWQFCIEDKVCMGRTWEEFSDFLDKLTEVFRLDSRRLLPVYVHYLAFEFQFMRNFVDVSELFARDKRVPMKAVINGAFEFRCSYFLSNMSLDKFIKNTPNAIFTKQSGDDFDYSKVRTPATVLSDEELSYCYCDVAGLCEALSHKMLEDNLAEIPMTSTGYVRRETRNAVLSNPDNKDEVEECRLNPAEYVLCKTAARGGNTHANAIYSDRTITGVKSKDIKSSYPAVMVGGDFPVTPFYKVRPSKSNLDKYIKEGYACLIEIRLQEVHVKSKATIPYLATAKCTYKRDTKENPMVVDNGRIVYCECIQTVITDVDWKIIDAQYNYDEIGVEVISLYIAEYGKLNDEFRSFVMEMFYRKEVLNPSNNPNADKYLYAKFKNMINAMFGMMLTDIASPEIIYVPEGYKHINSFGTSTVEYWKNGEIDLEYMLGRYYNSRNSFLTYQHGLWVTANARARLQQGIDVCGEDIVYVDTDSCKYVGNHDKEFEALNKLWYQQCEELDIKPYVEVNGKRIYLGYWDDDGEYSQFRTLGAKKYAYIEKGDDKNVLHITVAGLSKEKGAKYLMKKAKEENVNPIELFRADTIVPAGHSGRTVAHYNDLKEIKYITVDGCTFSVGSNIAVVNTSYTFGLSEDYSDYLTDLSPMIDAMTERKIRNSTVENKIE